MALAARGAPAEALDQLARYGELLLEANRGVNLTGARTPEAVADQIADAFPLTGYVHGPLVDVGAGGGLPGIPLAILTGFPVTLIEGTAKKVAFLSRALYALELDGQAVAGRAETLAHQPAYRSGFRHATARAVGSGPTVAELTLPFLEVGGTALLQRGRLPEDERNATRDAALILGGEVTEELALAGERCLLVITLRTQSAARFPRRVGVPEKRPLCLDLRQNVYRETSGGLG